MADSKWPAWVSDREPTGGRCSADGAWREKEEKKSGFHCTLPHFAFIDPPALYKYLDGNTLTEKTEEEHTKNLVPP